MTQPIFQLRLSERRFGQVIVAFVALGFLALLAVGAMAGLVMAAGADRAAWVNHTYQVERRVDALRLHLDRMEASRRGFLLDHDPRFRAAYDAAAAATPADAEALARLTADNPRERPNIPALRAETASLEAKLETSIADAASGRDSKAAQDFESDGSVALARQAQRTTDAMIAEENRLLAQRTAAQRAYQADFFAVLAGAALLLVLVGVGSVLIILRYTRELARSRDETESANASLASLNDNLEQAIEDRTADLQRANEEIQRFAYIVSHDLRSPLVNVLGFTAELEAAARPIGALIARVETEAPQLLTDEVRRVVREEAPEALGFIRTSTQKMDRLINAILKLSREGRRTVTPEPLDMDALAQGVADSLQHRVDDLGAEIVVEKPLPPVTTDRVMIEQILSNLVENAVKYLQPGRPGRIRISGRRDLARVIYEIADNGRGIDPKDHERIFDLFRRSGVQDQPGEGIGLAHVRTATYRLGGIVTCESALGQGAVFRVSLPAAYAEESSR